MKKTLATLAFASLSAGAIFAQEGIPGVVVDATIGYESDYVYRGKEIAGDNTQTRLRAAYAIPGNATLPITVYGQASVVSPIKDANRFNEVDWNLGTMLSYESWKIDAGWLFYTYPNGAITNRSNEFYIGASLPLEYAINVGAYVYYDHNFRQFTSEVFADHEFKGEDFGISNVGIYVRAYAGYLRASRALGDQNNVPKFRNDYGYIGGSADLLVYLTPAATASIGVRYAWNNDNSITGAPSNGQDSMLWWAAALNFKY